jgi:Rhodopirellula transposase DDE domain
MSIRASCNGLIFRCSTYRTGYHQTIAMNWRGTPLVDFNTIVSLISSTHRRPGLHVRAELDRGRYPAGITVTDTQVASGHYSNFSRTGPSEFALAVSRQWRYALPPEDTDSLRTLLATIVDKVEIRTTSRRPMLAARLG